MALQRCTFNALHMAECVAQLFIALARLGIHRSVWAQKPPFNVIYFHFYALLIVARAIFFNFYLPLMMIDLQLNYHMSHLQYWPQGVIADVLPSHHQSQINFQTKYRDRLHKQWKPVNATNVYPNLLLVVAARFKYLTPTMKKSLQTENLQTNVKPGIINRPLIKIIHYKFLWIFVDNFFCCDDLHMYFHHRIEIVSFLYSPFTQN